MVRCPTNGTGQGLGREVPEAAGGAAHEDAFRSVNAVLPSKSSRSRADGLAVGRAGRWAVRIGPNVRLYPVRIGEVERLDDLVVVAACLAVAEGYEKLQLLAVLGQERFAEARRS